MLHKKFKKHQYYLHEHTNTPNLTIPENENQERKKDSITRTGCCLKLPT